MVFGRRSLTRLLFGFLPTVLAAKPDKMEPVLRALFAAWRKGGAKRWKKEAARLLITVDHRRVALRITVEPIHEAEHVRRVVLYFGGVNVAAFDRYLYVTVPASALRPLSDHRSVAAMTLDTVDYNVAEP